MSRTAIHDMIMDQSQGGFVDGGYVSGDTAERVGEVACVLRPGESWLNAEPSQLDRIEAKLDSLIAALAEDDPEQEPGVDLDGNDVGGERDTTQTL